MFSEKSSQLKILQKLENDSLADDTCKNKPMHLTIHEKDEKIEEDNRSNHKNLEKPKQILNQLDINNQSSH